jgi:hypothetical protein
VAADRLAEDDQGLLVLEALVGYYAELSAGD